MRSRLLIAVLAVSIALVSAYLLHSLYELHGTQVNKEEIQNVSIVMPDGEKLIAEVSYGNKTEITVKLKGRTIAREELSSGKMSKEEVEKVVRDLISTLRQDQKLQAMTRIIYWGEKRGIPSEVCTKAANEFGKCLDEGKNPDVCVRELKPEYRWMAGINFSDLILLYNRS